MLPNRALTSNAVVATAAASAGGEDAASKLSLEAESVVADLVSSLDRRRLYREVTLGLRSGLRDSSADFSFLRLRGLRNLLKCLKFIAGSDAAIRLFGDAQTIPQLQVIPVLFENSLQQLKGDPILKLDHIFGVEPMKINSPATDSEIALALRVLEGCCLLHNESISLAHQYKAVKVLLNILSTRGALEQNACLDALISLMLDSSANQKDFEESNGVEKIAELIKDEQVDEHTRLKCCEFLLLLIGHVNGRRDQAPLATIHDDIMRLLGERSASLIWAASQFGSTLDPEQRQMALHIQARRVLESVEIY